MPTPRQLQPANRPRPGRPVGAIALMLAILATVIFAGTLQLRQKIRAQITKRDGDILHAVALMQQISSANTKDFGDELEQFADQFNVALQVSQLNQGIIGTRLFDPDGHCRASFPAYVRETTLAQSDLDGLRQLRPVCHFHDRVPLNQFLPHDLQPSSLRSAIPLLEVTIPLHRQNESRLLGVAQFIIDGQSIAAEFVRLDRHLLVQATIAFLAGGALIVLTLTWALHQLRQSNRLLLDRSQHLLRANEQLALAAKTSALGTVTAHLLHGLSNPLAGLQDFVASKNETTPPDTQWDTVRDTTRRMQSLVADVMRVLGEDQTERYELTVAELVQSLGATQTPLAEAAGVSLITTLQAEGWLDNRQANLLMLILNNLIQNAIQATPPGKQVHLSVTGQTGPLQFAIQDQGPGFPESLKGSIFSPCRSTKAGGSGIGLAISQQLARHLGAELELQSSTAQGCLFTLTLSHVPSKPGSHLGSTQANISS